MAVTSVEQAAQGVWARVTEKARSELPESSFTMWFSEVRPTSLEGDVLQLGVPSEYVREWLVRHYLPLIQTVASEAVGSPLRIHVVTEPPSETVVAQGSPETPVTIPDAGPKGTSGEGVSSLLFPDRYTFDAFVPGPSNRFAHAAAMAVAEARPSKAYNPLFIYGGVGLGKTHLLYAIGHYMTRLNPGMRCKYVTSETFVTEFIKAVRERQAYQFQRKYRDVDLLMVDDIQFLVRAEETQQEFFHTFNYLHAASRQIVIASDRPPQDLQGMAERLINRFRWGLSVAVQPPALETRIAILQLKAKRDRIDVPFDVLELIATKFDQNIRELEGALLRVAAFG